MVLDFRFGQCPNREWGKGHFHLLKWPFPQNPHIIICQFKKNPPWYIFFVSVHVPATSVVYCNENLRWSTGECIIVYYSAQWVIVQVSYSPAPQSTPPTRPIPGILTRQHSLKFILLSMNISEIQKYLNILEIHNPTFYICLMKCISTKIPRSSQNTMMLAEVWKFGPEIPNG